MLLDSIKKNLRLILFFIVIVVSSFIVYNPQNIDVSLREPSYDELMWTNTSIATYHMFIGYQRENIKDDPWFTNFAYKYGLDIFKPVRNNRLEVDLNKISQKEYQWFDATLWTFGWKAPNFTKLIKGWYISQIVPDINPYGYYELGDASKGENPGIHYSRVPVEYVKYGRQVDSFFSLGSLVLVFLIGSMLFSNQIGIISWLYLLFNAKYILVTTSAGMDSALFFFSLATIFFVHLLIKEFIRNDSRLISNISFSILTGLSIGLAISSKLNGATLIFSLIYIAPFIIYLLFKYDPSANYDGVVNSSKAKVLAKRINDLKKLKIEYLKLKFKLLLVLIPVLLISLFSVFFFFNPQLRSDTSKKVSIIQESVDEFFSRRAKALNTEKIKNSWKESFNLVVKKNYFSTSEPDTKGFIGTFGNQFDFSIKVFDGLFLVLGLVILIIETKNKIFGNNEYTPALIILVTYFVIFYMNTDFIWVDYTRYFTPFYISGVFVIASGIGVFVDQARKLKKIFKKITRDSLWFKKNHPPLHSQI